MTPERWREIKAVFQAVIELPVVERAARLAAADAETRREVEQLLAAATTGAADFLERPAAVELVDEQLGRRVGPWRIVAELGRGGMGAVYRARRDDAEVEGEVALKVVKRGMDTDFVLRRFRAERQILAGLSHPNVARLLDAGTTDDGRPWFAMELVHGEPIDRHALRLALGVRERVELLITVCGAVHHAHQNLIVHRDLKPSNILVTDDGRPVLLDFGIAKLLDPEVDATATGVALMTPAYASPEQLTGKPVTTASDVYSLGVLAFELLAGARPYAGGSAESIVRALERGDVPSASAAAARARLEPRRVRALRGDLDAIVAMAMRPEPAQRYSSARELAQDLRAHLAGLPTVARREGLLGRSWKLVRWHRVVVVASAAVVVALVGGVVATTHQARIARAERARAERRFDETRRLAGRVIFELHDAVAELPGSTAARVKLVEESITYLEELAREARGRPDLLVEVSSAWARLGDVQGNLASANLGQRDLARDSYARALSMAEEARRHAPADRAARLAVAIARNRAGDMDFDGNDLVGAAQEYQASIALLRPLAVDAGDDVEPGHQLACSLIDLADSVAATEAARALALYREALALEEALAARSQDPRLRRTLSLALNKVARAEEKAGDRSTALARFRQALAIREELLARAPTSAAARRDVSISIGHIARVLRAEHDLAGALAAYRHALEISRAAADADPLDVRAMRDVIVDDLKVAEIEHEAAPTAPGGARVAALQAACARFAGVLDAWHRLQARAGTVAGDEGIDAKVQDGIARCQADLAAAIEGR